MVFTPSKKATTDFNNGNKYKKGGGISATDLNNIVESCLFAQENGGDISFVDVAKIVEEQSTDYFIELCNKFVSGKAVIILIYYNVAIAVNAGVALVEDNDYQLIGTFPAGAGYLVQVTLYKDNETGKLAIKQNDIFVPQKTHYDFNIFEILTTSQDSTGKSHLNFIVSDDLFSILDNVYVDLICFQYDGRSIIAITNDLATDYQYIKFDTFIIYMGERYETSFIVKGERQLEILSTLGIAELQTIFNETFFYQIQVTTL